MKDHLELKAYAKINLGLDVVRKREDGVLDFNDMEHFALQILVDHEQGDVPSAVAKELQEYYQEIMIDEYQDSSYIQEALLSSLSRAEQGQRPYLFMVGDVKQSISGRHVRSYLMGNTRRMEVTRKWDRE